MRGAREQGRSRGGAFPRPRAKGGSEHPNPEATCVPPCLSVSVCPCAYFCLSVCLCVSVCTSVCVSVCPCGLGLSSVLSRISQAGAQDLSASAVEEMGLSLSPGHLQAGGPVRASTTPRASGRSLLLSEPQSPHLGSGNSPPLWSTQHRPGRAALSARRRPWLLFSEAITQGKQLLPSSVGCPSGGIRGDGNRCCTYSQAVCRCLPPPGGEAVSPGTVHSLPWGQGLRTTGSRGYSPQ